MDNKQIIDFINFYEKNINFNHHLNYLRPIDSIAPIVMLNNIFDNMNKQFDLMKVNMFIYTKEFYNMSKVDKIKAFNNFIIREFIDKDQYITKQLEEAERKEKEKEEESEEAKRITLCKEYKNY